MHVKKLKFHFPKSIIMTKLRNYLFEINDLMISNTYVSNQINFDVHSQRHVFFNLYTERLAQNQLKLLVYLPDCSLCFVLPNVKLIFKTLHNFLLFL